MVGMSPGRGGLAWKARPMWVPGRYTPLGEKADGRYAVGFFFRLPARHVRFRRFPLLEWSADSVNGKLMPTGCSGRGKP